jgi:hypothetical protein
MIDYSAAFDLAREAAVDGCPVAMIATRVRTLILSTTPAESCGPERLDSIARGVADALDGRSPLIPSRTTQWSDDDGRR